MKILGINSVFHEMSAALIVDGEVVAAAEEERFTRVKHGKEARVDNPHVMPARAVQFCLDFGGVAPEELDAVAYSFSPSMRRQTFEHDRLSRAGDWGDAAGEEIFIAALERVPAAASELLGRDVTDCFHWVPHHLAHAASTFYPSGHHDAAILVVDGIGENITTLMAAGEGTSLKWHKAMMYPHSLGFVWEKMAKFLGFSEYDACKVMGLAGYGDPAMEAASFAPFIHLNGNGFKVNSDVMEFRLDSFGELEKYLGQRRQGPETLSARHVNIAATLQSRTNDIVLSLVKELYALHPSETLCLCGGVALNCTTNWVVKEQGPFRNVYIPSAPHDAGTAVGAALDVYFRKLNGSRGPAVMNTAYLGPEFSEADILAALRDAGLTARRSDDVAGEVAEMIAAGNIVGWFQGRMEFGPRALGNRSLLADPRDAGTREKMNRKVKHRENFRPFAPSVLAEHCDEWFQTGNPSDSYSYMLFACPALPGKAELVPAIMHVDGTARLQVVTKEQNSKYHQLISRFMELTGVPLVLNTSFNDCEPIVCSPQDAIATFQGTAIDALTLGDYIVRR